MDDVEMRFRSWVLGFTRADDDVAREAFSLARRFTRGYRGETPGSAGEPKRFHAGRSGADAANIVRARPMGSRPGGIPLALELLDLLHIQLQCPTGERVVRGAVAIGFLSASPDRGGSPCTTPATYDWLKGYHNARIDDDLARPEGISRADECDRNMAGALTPRRIA